MQLNHALTRFARCGVSVTSAVILAAVMVVGCAHEPRFADGLNAPGSRPDNTLGQWRPPTERDFHGHDHDHDHTITTTQLR